VFAELLSRLGAAFDRHGLPYMVIGGQAVLVHGEPRLTRDIDITVGVGVEGIDRVLALVAELGLQPLADDPRAFAVETMVVPALDESSGIRVDLILSRTPYGAEAIGRVRDCGPAHDAQLSHPDGLAVGDGALYILDSGNNRVRMVVP
jgi:hypothetical protein